MMKKKEEKEIEVAESSKKKSESSMETLLTDVNKAFKDNDFSIAVEKDFISKLDWLSSGNYAINYSCTGDPYKAIPFGRIVSLVGDSGSGKSLLADHFLAETQKLGGLGVLFDVERAGYVQMMEKLGIDVSKLVVSGSKILEDIFEKAIYFIKSFNEVNKNKVPLTIVIDSISQASSRSEVEEGFDKSDMKRAQVIRKGLRMVSGLISDHKVCLIIINHQMVGMSQYGPPKVTTGGTSVEYFPSQIIEVNKGKKIVETRGDQEVPIGMEIRVKINKSRFYIPFITSKVEVYFGKGLDPYSGLFDILVSAGVVKKVSAAGWWAFSNDPDKKIRETEIKEIIIKDVQKYLNMIKTDQIAVIGIEQEGNTQGDE